MPSLAARQELNSLKCRIRDPHVRWSGRGAGRFSPIPIWHLREKVMRFQVQSYAIMGVLCLNVGCASGIVARESPDSPSIHALKNVSDIPLSCIDDCAVDNTRCNRVAVNAHDSCVENIKNAMAGSYCIDVLQDAQFRCMSTLSLCRSQCL